MCRGIADFAERILGRLPGTPLAGRVRMRGTHVLEEEERRALMDRPRPRALPIAPNAPPPRRRLPLASEAREIDRACRPIYAVWEVTLRCDLACRTCGSRAGHARSDELDTAQCLDLVRQMSELGVAPTGGAGQAVYGAPPSTGGTFGTGGAVGGAPPATGGSFGGAPPSTGGVGGARPSTGSFGGVYGGPPGSGGVPSTGGVPARGGSPSDAGAGGAIYGGPPSGGVGGEGGEDQGSLGGVYGAPPSGGDSGLD